MIDLGDTAGEDLSRMAYNAFTRALSGRSKSKTTVKGDVINGNVVNAAGAGDSAQRWMTIESRSEAEHMAVQEALSEHGVSFNATWSPDFGRGQFAVAPSDVQKVMNLMGQGALANPQASPGPPSMSAQDLAARGVGQDSFIIFQTREDDPGAKIIANALQREGVKNFTVATPDPQGQVLISVASADAPALVQVAESYIDQGVIDATRFEGLETLKERAAIEHRAQTEARAGDFQRAQERAEAIARNRSVPAPELSRSVSR